jgi:hypothetical protein
MFSFLAPSLLWLAPLLAVPLAIALLGRAQPKTRDFPSLLPVRESLQRAMRKHRLKNWLQLILRTLAILFLLLAAANPVWRTGVALQPPRVAAVLVHNGAYAAAGPDALLAGLDSLTQGNTVVEPLLPEVYTQVEGRRAARFGSSLDGYTRLLQSASESRGDVHVYAPVYNSRDLAALARVAGPWLETHPDAQLIVVDHDETGAHLQAFDPVQAAFEKEGVISLRANTEAARTAPIWAPARSRFSGGGPVRSARIRSEGGQTLAEITIPVPEQSGGTWIIGTLSLNATDSVAHSNTAITNATANAGAYATYSSVAAAFRVPPPALLCHVGGREAVASLATLGTGGPRLRVQSLLSPGSGSVNAPPATGACDLLYLADPPDADAALLQRAAAVIRSGGKVVLETGPHTDPVLWNRNLLVPLGIGRLTTVVTRDKDSKSGKDKTAHMRRPALAALGMRADRFGRPGTVSTQFGFLPAAGTEVLVATGDEASTIEPVLLHRRIGRGELLLWTTSLSNPHWSDIGLGPWAALAHQAFLAKAWAAGIESRTVDTDSLLLLPALGTDALDGKDGGDERPPHVIDPDGKPFTRIRSEPGGWVAGPFDKPGLYRVESSEAADPGTTQWFAANLARPPAAATSDDWEVFRETIGKDAWKKTTVLKAGKDWRDLYGGLHLRLGLLGIAALLLFAEGVVSLRLTHLPESRNH